MIWRSDTCSRSGGTGRLCCALVALVLATRVARGQVFMVNGDGAEPQQKFDGFSVRKEAGKFNDALDDFARYRDKKAWELAFRSLETLGEAKRDGMVPAGNGFFVPSRQRVLSSLTSLPPEGKQAFRLFYDAKARQLLERIEAAAKAGADTAKPVDEIAALREIFDKYFISSVGDRAADRLGDALFETGDFAFAAVTWGAILKEFPDTSLSPVRLQVKRCTALARAGQWDLFDEALREVRGKFAGERVTVGGKEIEAAEHLASLKTSLASTQPIAAVASAVQSTGPFELPAEDKPAWQIKLIDENLNRKLSQALNNNNWGSQFSGLRRAVPSSATDGKRVYVNWLGVVFAADVNTGKMVWRNRKFSELGDKFMNFVNMLTDTDSYTATVIGENLFVTGINLDRINNHQEPVRLVCMNGADGKVKWSSSSGSLSNWNFCAPPTAAGPAGDVIYATARPRNAMDVSLLAIGVAKGELLWQVLLGTAQGSPNYRGETDIGTPLIVPAGGGALYVITNNGALLSVDPAARRLNWAFSFQGAPIVNRQNWGWNGEMMASGVKMTAAAFLDGSTLYFKEEGADAVYSVDVMGPSLLWKRPIDSENSVVPLGNGRLLTVGQDIGVIDAKAPSRPLTWSTPLPALVGRVTPLVSEDRVLAFAPRGIYEIDLADGDTVRIFRGADRESIGGVLRRAPGRLICVSNLAITAYPTSDGARHQAANR